MSVSIRTNIRRTIEQAAFSPGKLAGVILLFAVVTASALYYAFTAVQAWDTSYQVSRALEEQKELHETGRRLRVEYNHLMSPERLERYSENQGLAIPRPEQIRGLP